MAFPFDNAIVEMCFATPLLQKLIDSGPAELWPLDNLQGNITGIIDGLVQDEADGLNRNVAGMLPEYGGAMGFNGTSSFIAYAHDAVLNGSTSWAVAFVLKLGSSTISATQTIITKNFSSGTTKVEVALTSSAGGTITANAYIGSVQRSISYVIPDRDDWRDNPRLIIVRYTGSAFDLIEADATGAVNTRATLAVSGTFNSGTGTGELVVAATASVSPAQFFNGTLQHLAWWTNDYPTDAEITDFAKSLVWTDVTDDVTADSVEAEWGIAGSGPLDRLCGVGMMQFALLNHSGNSAGLTGYYSPDHANARAGFQFGNMVRLSVIDPADSSTYRRFVGRLVRIEPVPGESREQITECLAVDYMDELTRARVPTLPLVDDEPSVTLIGRIIDNLAVTPHRVSAASDGVETFSYGLDADAQRDRPKAAAVINDLIRSELGWLYMRGDAQSGGVLAIDTHQTRAIDVTPDWTFSNTMRELEVSRDRADVLTRVELTLTPRAEDALAVTLFSLGAPVLFNYGTSRTIICPFTDPDNPGAQVGGVDDGTLTLAYTFHANQAGTGTEYSAFIQLRQSIKGANQWEVELVYGGQYVVADLWLTSLTVTGKPIKSYEPVVFRAEAGAALMSRAGENILEFDQPYQTDLTRGSDAANYLQAGWGQERTVARSLMTRVGAGSPAALITAALKADVGDLVAITETMTGLASEHYFVNGISTRIGRGVVETELRLAPRELQSWVLGVSGFSELGETTVLGF